MIAIFMQSLVGKIKNIIITLLPGIYAQLNRLLMA